MMKHLITGSSGFLASNLYANSSNYSDYELTGRTNNRITELNANFINSTELFKINRSYDTIFHLAAQLAGKNTSSKDLFDANVNLTKELVTKINYKKFIYASSVSVFGQNEKNEVLNEDSRILNPEEYGISKYWGEQIVKSSPEFSIIRFSSIYGPNMNENTLIPIYINQALNYGLITIWGDGSRKQNYIHVNDAANLLLKAKDSEKNGIYLGTQTKEYSNLEIAEIIAGYTSTKIDFKGTDYSSSFFYNNDKTRSLMKWEPQIDIEKGIIDYIKWKEKQF